MQSNFIITFDERDDGKKTWSATCSSCATSFVGERYPQVSILRVNSDNMPPSQFDQLKRTAAAAWKQARENGTPVIIGDHRIVVDKTIDHGDLQRALEAHAENCPAKR